MRSALCSESERGRGAGRRSFRPFPAGRIYSEAK